MGQYGNGSGVGNQHGDWAENWTARDMDRPRSSGQEYGSGEIDQVSVGRDRLGSKRTREDGPEEDEMERPLSRLRN